MRKKSLETSNMKQPKIETEKNIEFLKEEIKKSAIHAKDSYDYQKLCVKRNGLLSCHYEEDREDLYFYYTVKGMNPFTQVKSESREKKYQILINFSKLKELQADFLLKLTEENLYYDENGLLYLKDRDISFSFETGLSCPKCGEKLTINTKAVSCPNRDFVVWFTPYGEKKEKTWKEIQDKTLCQYRCCCKIS